MPLALAWMCGAVASFLMVAVAGRAAGAVMSTLDMMFYRSAIALVILVAALRLTGFDFTGLATRRLGLHGLRNGVHFVGQAAWLHALMLIPLATLHAIEFTFPLWVALMAPFILGEKLTQVRILAASLGFIGALIIVRPGVASIGLGTSLALVCALSFAMAQILTKLQTRTESPAAILFYMQLMQSVLAFVLLLGAPKLPDAATFGWLFLLGLGGMLAHFAMIKAFSHADATVVSPMDFLRLPCVAVLGVMFYNEAIDWLVLLGGAIVVGANLMNLWGEHRLRRRGA